MTLFTSTLLALLATSASPTADSKQPNVIVILADDVGYGDLSCYGATRIQTPNLDRLAAAGLKFTDAHAPSATCTPTRYALLTGEYAWRKKGTGVLTGDANLIIEPGRFTLPAMLKRAGYATGVVGKWHLGLGQGPIDWNHEIKPGPREIGFDESFIIAGTGDRVPCVYLENQRVAGLDPNDPIEVSYQHKVGDEPTGRENPELLKMRLSHGHDFTIVNGISRIGWMKGGKSARWVDEDMADRLTEKATAFIEAHRAEPFFLYFATHDAHVPRVPHARFKGASGCGVRGDAVQELDWCVGQVMETLDRLKLTENTLLIFTSDNGPVLDDGYADGAVADANGHLPSGPWRGGKYSSYEGGTRVPFLLRWPARVKPGTSAALICQIDLLASLGALLGQATPEGAAPDSENVLAALLGESAQGRETLVEHAAGLALRKGQWKYVAPRPPRKPTGKPPAARSHSPGELYNLADDPGESKDLAGARPDLARELDAELSVIRDRRGGL